MVSVPRLASDSTASILATRLGGMPGESRSESDPYSLPSYSLPALLLALLDGGMFRLVLRLCWPPPSFGSSTSTPLSRGGNPFGLVAPAAAPSLS